MSSIDALRIFALIILFGLIWNTLKVFAVERFPALASAMDFLYA